MVRPRAGSWVWWSRRAGDGHDGDVWVGFGVFGHAGSTRVEVSILAVLSLRILTLWILSLRISILSILLLIGVICWLLNHLSRSWRHTAILCRNGSNGLGLLLFDTDEQDRDDCSAKNEQSDNNTSGNGGNRCLLLNRLS